MLVESMGDGWVAFSPLAGSTHFLNDTGAAMLDVLVELGPASSRQVAAMLASDVDMDPLEIEAALAPHWDELIAAGLIRVDAGRVH